MTTPIPSSPSQPQPVDLIVAAAVSAGWPMKSAFEAALQLLLHGVTVAEARQMFALCEEWRQ
jgi:hypothetical protein